MILGYKKKYIIMYIYIMESYVQSSEDFIVDSLNFKLGNTSEYVAKRRMVSFYPSGSNVYSSTSGTKTIKVKLASNTEWLDPSTIRLKFELNNTGTASANDLHLISGAHSFIERLRTLVSSQQTEDMANYARLYEQFLRCSNPATVISDGVESVLPYKKQENVADYTLTFGQSRTMSTKILSGILGGNTKMMPLKYMNGGIELEMELVNNPNDAVISTTANSASWTITNVEIQAELITLDSQLENEYANFLLKGGKIPIPYKNIIHTSQVINDSNFSVNVARSATRLDAIFLSFSGSFTGSLYENNSRDFNFFWHPSNANGRYSHNDQINLSVSIGANRYPEKPITSGAEAMYNLRKALGLHNTNQHAVDIFPIEYYSSSFIVGLNTERVYGSEFSGVNTRGELIVIEGKPQNASEITVKPTRLHIALMTSAILELSMDGCTIFD